MNFKGSCHCESVKFEVDFELESAMSCNCSICFKKGHLLAFTPEQNFKLISGSEHLSDYQFGKKTIHHMFCSKCGIATFGHGTDPKGNKVRAINIRCLAGVDVDKVEIVNFDGKQL